MIRDSKATGWFRCTIAMVAALLALAPAARAQEQERIGLNDPFLVKDINTAASASLSSSPWGYVVIGSTAYFVATTPAHGTELWRSDGTAAGTSMLRDIFPGVNSSNPSYLTNLGGTLYFFANDGAHGMELWKSNGTAAGTILLKDLRPGSEGSLMQDPRFMTLNGAFYFFANDGVSGRELWKSNGTTAGTVHVKDITPGTGNTASGKQSAVLNGNLYFFTSNAFHAASPGLVKHTLYKTNGTALGTVMIKDFDLVNVGALMNVGGTLYFMGEGVNGAGFWKSDGTTAGTVLLKKLPTTWVCSNPGSMIDMNGMVYFFHWNISVPYMPTKDLWKSNGTVAGTMLVKSFPSDWDDDYDLDENLLNVGGTLYFVANNADSDLTVWKSNGTAAGTQTLKGASGLTFFEPYDLMNVLGKACFVAYTWPYGFEFWQTDGSLAGTRMLTSFKPDDGNWGLTINGGHPYGSLFVQGQRLVAPVTPGGTLFFTADDGSHGAELWKTGGTPASTTLVKDSAIGSDAGIEHMSAAGAMLFFTADDHVHGRELWKSNVTPASTLMVKDIQPGPGSSLFITPGNYQSHLLTVNGTAWFTTFDETNYISLWKSNGTTAGTIRVKNHFYIISEMIAVNGRCVFLAYDEAHGTALWRTNAASTGVEMIKYISSQNVTQFLGYEDLMVNANGTIYFSMAGHSSINGLWKSNGTSAGTFRISTTPATGEMVAVGGKVFYIATSGQTDRELWVSDGTAIGTMRVKDIMPGTGGSDIANLTAMGNMLYFTATNGTYGTELWRSDGTKAGTMMVKDICPGPGQAFPGNLAVIGSTLYFTADDGVRGAELWKSTGTAAGTVLVKDICPGLYGSYPSGPVAVDGKLYFNAYSPSGGNELWQTDGTVTGTKQAADIIPGAPGSNPTNLTLVSNYLYFCASGANASQGRELWALRVR